jgi:hypothetical protein
MRLSRPPAKSSRTAEHALLSKAEAIAIVQASAADRRLW